MSESKLALRNTPEAKEKTNDDQNAWSSPGLKQITDKPDPVGTDVDLTIATEPALDKPPSKQVIDHNDPNGTNVDISLAPDIVMQPNKSHHANNENSGMTSGEETQVTPHNLLSGDSIPEIRLSRTLTERLPSEDSCSFLPNGEKIHKEKQHCSAMRVKSGVTKEKEEDNCQQFNIQSLCAIAATYPAQHEDCSLTDQLEPTRCEPLTPAQQAGRDNLLSTHAALSFFLSYLVKNNSK